MKKHGIVLAALVLFLAVYSVDLFHPVAATATAIASEESHEEAGAEHSGEAHHETIWQKIGKWVNFIALGGILYWFLGRTLRIQDLFKSDYEIIRKSIESARQAKEEAEARLKELDERVAQVESEAEKIKVNAEKEAEEEKRRILDSAKREAERIVELAHREMESEVQLARKQLRKQVADLSVEQGRQIVEKEINDADHKRLISDYIEGFRK